MSANSPKARAAFCAAQTIQRELSTHLDSEAEHLVAMAMVVAEAVGADRAAVAAARATIALGALKSELARVYVDLLEVSRG